MKSKRRNRENYEEIRANIIVAAMCLAIIFMLVFAIKLYLERDYTYAIPCENGNGIHYEYVTDKVCTVTEINDNLITVETREGNLYEFYGTGYKVNDKIICVFNKSNEIIDTK